MYICIYMQIYICINPGSNISQSSGHQPSIFKTIQIRWKRYAGHCWRSKNTHKRCSPMDLFTRAHMCWTTN